MMDCTCCLGCRFLGRPHFEETLSPWPWFIHQAPSHVSNLNQGKLFSSKHHDFLGTGTVRTNSREEWGRVNRKLFQILLLQAAIGDFGRGWHSSLSSFGVELHGSEARVGVSKSQAPRRHLEQIPGTRTVPGSWSKIQCITCTQELKASILRMLFCC